MSMTESAISLMKCTLDMLLPSTFWLLNLLSRTRDFQSQILQFLNDQSVGPRIDSPNIVSIVRDGQDRVVRMEGELQGPRVVF